ncbi:helix-turn-helix transcriptional regulator [Saccharopolyspora sp. HNM0983]|uniref:Helix-turn-helix transcriptional regulator n=1 Tax=Saccharopolyspora montiporae TaxID=2781240 RepID=A0A929B8R0_9PSEU|nr:helix-turn-helix transcriptional regulator [Saccharopolyspora sp. HNM0983]MBE9374280.1 helix-turn-helix transcriptional regulator [Saccharopolyspora sp. HNM0983]
MTVLLREAVGERLRRARTAQSRTLRDVSRAARVSLGYLSEVERGRKEASSELLASICGALELPLPDLLVTVAGDLDDTMVAPDGVDRPVGEDVDGDALVPSLLGAQLAESELSEQQFAGAEAAADGDLRLQPVLSQRISAPVRKSGGVVVAA